MGALRISRDGGVLRITLARPETRNALDAALVAELAEAFVDVGGARAVVLADDLEAALERVLAELASAGPKAARAAKRLVLDRPDGPETSRIIAERRTSPEGQEGLRAYLERRKPDWAP